jgi:hypothetical protein
MDSEMPDQQPKKRSRLTPADRATIVARVKSGETLAAVGQDYGISRQAVQQMRNKEDIKAGLIKRDPKRRITPKKHLFDDEWQQLEKLIKETTPGDHGLIQLDDSAAGVWSMPRAMALARKVFGRSPSVIRMQALLKRVAPRTRRVWPLNAPPEPPVRYTRKTLPLSAIEDPEFGRYLLSDICWQIQQREYELALKDYESRLELDPRGSAKQTAPLSVDEDFDPDDDLDPAKLVEKYGQLTDEPRTGFYAPPSPGERVGKHKGNRQQPKKKQRKGKKKRR